MRAISLFVGERKLMKHFVLMGYLSLGCSVIFTVPSGSCAGAGKIFATNKRFQIMSKPNIVRPIFYLLSDESLMISL